MEARPETFKRTDDKKYDVFLSHAGEQKRDFVDHVYEKLKDVKLQSGSDFEVFMDDSSLQPGYEGWPKIEQAAEQSCIGVFILTPQFVRKRACMDEVQIFLKRLDAGQKVKLLPVFLDLTWGQCQNLSYKQDEPWITDKKKPSDADLATWVAIMKRLSSMTGLRNDQAGFFEGRMVNMVVDNVVQLLKDEVKLDTSYVRGKSFVGPFCAPAITSLVGRDREVEEVVEAIRGDRLVSVVGDPGEGKTFVALRAAHKLYRSGSASGGVYVVDMAAGHLYGEGVQDLKAYVAAMVFTTHQSLRDSQRTTPSMPLMTQPTWEAMLAWLRAKKPGPVLLLLENVEQFLTPDDTTAAPPSKDGVQEATEEGSSSEDEATPLEQLQQMLREAYGTVLPDDGPAAGRRAARIILASRFAMSCPMPADVEEAPAVLIQPLEGAAAQELLHARAGKAVEWPEYMLRHVADDVCRRNALALVIIGGFIRVGRCTPQDAWERFRDLGNKLDDAVEASGPASAGVAGNIRRNEQYRLNRAWLQEYLTPEETLSLAQLSVFSGSFDIAGVEEVASCLPDTTSGDDFVGLLQEISVVRGVVTTSRTMAPRFAVHLLVRQLAGDMLQGVVRMKDTTGGLGRDALGRRVADARTHARRSFVRLMLQRREPLLAANPDGAAEPAPRAASDARDLVAAEVQNVLQLPWLLGQDELKVNFGEDGFVTAACDLVRALQVWGQYYSAKRVCGRVAELASSLRGAADAEAVSARVGVGLLHVRDGKGAEAAQVFRSLLETAGLQHAQRANLQHLLGRALYLCGGGDNLREAAALLREAALEMARRGDPREPDAWAELGNVLDTLGDADGAEAARVQASSTVGESSDVGVFFQAKLLLQQGRDDEAEALFMGAGVGGELHWRAYGLLVAAKVGRGRLDEALLLVDTGLEAVKRRFGDKDVQYAKLLKVKVDVLLAGDGGGAAMAQAEALCREATEIYEDKTGGGESVQAAFVEEARARVLERLGRWREAERATRNALRWFGEGPGGSIARAMAGLRLRLAGMIVRRKDFGALGEVRTLVEAGLGSLDEAGLRTAGEMIQAMLAWAQELGRQSDLEGATDVCAAALAVAEGVGAAGERLLILVRVEYARVWGMLAEKARQEGGEADGYLMLAAQQMEEAYQGARAAAGPWHPKTLKVALQLVQLKGRQGSEGEVTELCMEILGAALQALEAPELPQGLAEVVPVMVRLGAWLQLVVGHFDASQIMGQAASVLGRRVAPGVVAAMMQQ